MQINTAVADHGAGFFSGKHLLLVVTAALVLGWPVSSSAGRMKGPPAASAGRSPAVETPNGPSKLLLSSIRFFQEYISPTDGARCQFAPTCSAFGHRAISEHGPLLGILMTADRLMRCSVLTDPAFYRKLPNGRLADPVPTN